MAGRKAQIATEYIIITSLILIVATMVFAYSYVSNTQNVRINQANNAVERIINTADLVYALGPGNSQFVEVTFPQGLELIQDLTLCQGASGTYQNHYGEGEASCPEGEVKAGAIEMQLSRLGGTTSIRSSSKAEIEMDVVLPEETVQPTMGKHIIKVYWCGEKICVSSTEYAVSEECLNGLTQDCPLKTANCLANPATCTCTTALETCIGGVWPGCEKETYQDFNASYEIAESSCSDKIDNDCDGLVDCYDLACATNPVCMCDNGETSLCLLQDGVCAGSFETCTARQWPGCNSGSYGPDYENTETSCNDNKDNDCDALTDCLDSDCVDDVACGYLEKTTIYIAQNISNGQLGGRTGADAFCNDIANKPTNLPSTCSNAHIFLSITDSDEIKDMPINYGYNSENPVYWWHSTNGTYTMLATNWPDMFDGSILANLTTGTGDAGLGIWTGSTSDGSIHIDNCLGWTSKSNQELGKTGSSSSTTGGWLASISQGCEKNNTYSNIPCITECSTELNCKNGADDDGDGQTDCDDTDCTAAAVCQANKTTIYIATVYHDGDFASEGGGDARIGADAFCNDIANKPSNLSATCSNTKAFINVSGTDEIVDMRSDNGGPYTSSRPVYWWNNTSQRYNQFASNWDDMLDGDIALSQLNGTEISVDAWSGSSWNGGSSSTTNCLGWTSSDIGQQGTDGKADDTGTAWLIRGNRTCNQAQSLRCITECQTETECSNSLDDDADTLIDCDDPDCATNAACPITETKTTIYMATSTHDGDLGGRAGADTICGAEQPGTLPASCSNVRAFVSVSASDEIVDMPTVYGFDSAEAVYWWHNTNQEYNQLAINWADMLDGSILVGQLTGTGVSGYSWTGTQSNGAKASSTCQGWGSTSQFGTEGTTSTSTSWLDNAERACSISTNGLRCIAECETEADCTNTVDDDSDGQTDCADIDCSADPACAPETNCSNAIDDDSDTFTDCADTDCSGMTGPSGETCEPSGETLCTDTYDNDNDGLTDCADTDCSADPSCAAGGYEQKTTVYMTNEVHQGNLGGKPGADAICVSEAPANLPGSCTITQAMLCTSSETVAGMQSSSGGPYSSTEPIYWWHSTNGTYTQFASDWTDMLDGTISASQGSGTGYSGGTGSGDNAWSGCQSDGTLYPSFTACDDWTSKQGQKDATYGANNTTSFSWIASSAVNTSCGQIYRLRCITECKKEIACSNWADDDSDTYADCADMDCDGQTGPSGETCEPAGETSCTDTYDNDNDGQTDCADTDCGLNPICGNVAYSAAIYMATSTHNGDLGGRAGADAICEAEKPANLPAEFDSIHAFLSMGASDEIRDIPSIYGYDSGNPIYWWHSTNGTLTKLADDWADMLDGSILVGQLTGTGVSGYSWTGTQSNGAKASSTCQGWASSSQYGNEGTTSTSTSWLDNAERSCSIATNGLRCMARFLAEKNCINGQDDDQDGQTDCSDSDCDEHIACSGATLKTTVYITEDTHMGDFGDKATADAMCEAEKPANLPGNCTDIQAMVCYTTSNVSDMQSSSGGPYLSAEPVHWWHSTNGTWTQFASDWADMLDGSISVTQTNGTGWDWKSYTGCQQDGTYYLNYNCDDWSRSSGYVGAYANANSTDSTWISRTGINEICGYNRKIRCLASCYDTG